jgi:hypothetical protein
VRIVSWVGKFLGCCRGYWICGGGGGGRLTLILTWGLALFSIGYVICGTVEGDMLFVKLAKVGDDWLWHNDTIGNKPEVGLGCFGRIVVEKVKGKMESNGASEEPTA